MHHKPLIEQYQIPYRIKYTKCKQIVKISKFTLFRCYFPLENLKQAVGIYDNTQLIYQWKQLWYDYICNLLYFFNKNGIMDQLLVYNLDIDSKDKFELFFNNNDIPLKIKHFQQVQGKTENLITNNRINEWNFIIKQNIELNNTESNEYDNISNECQIRNIFLNI